MNYSRPKNLNLLTIRFPIPAIVSILHRLTGVFLFLLIPIALYELHFSLTPAGFDTLKHWFDLPLVKLLFWVLFIPFSFHLIAGIRHLLSDIHIGDTLKAGRLTALLVFIVTALFVLLAGIWIW